jgi:DNA-binding MarR family transcriptional regulator
MPEEELLRTAMEVRHGVNRLGRRLRSERPEHSVPLLHLSVLARLQRRGPLTPGQLAAAERLQPQSLTRALASLEAEQLISRQADPADRRRSLLAISDKGVLALRRDVGQRDAWLALAMAEHLTRTERELLRLASDLLERLADIDDIAALRGQRAPRSAGHPEGVQEPPPHATGAERAGR